MNVTNEPRDRAAAHRVAAEIARILEGLRVNPHDHFLADLLNAKDAELCALVGTDNVQYAWSEYRWAEKSYDPHRVLAPFYLGPREFECGVKLEILSNSSEASGEMPTETKGEEA